MNADKVIEMVKRFRGQPEATGLPPRWWMTEEVQEAHRLLAAEFIEALPAQVSAEAAGEGDGIVICGGGRYWPSAWVTINMIRHFGCRLPIELWYMGPEEMPEDRQMLVAGLGVRCVDVERVRKAYPIRTWGGWQAKPFAVWHSSFQRVLYLDADCYPVTDPTFLFERPELVEKGAIFFPDCFPERLPAQTWRAFGLEPRDEAAFESGQFLVNKGKCWREMPLAMHFCDHSDYYFQWTGNNDPDRLVYGDKDCFHMAWWLLNKPYAMWHQAPGVKDGAYLHYGPDNQLLFIHRCRNKFRLNNDSFPTQQWTDKTLFCQDLPLEQEAHDYLEELREPPPVWKASRPLTLGVPTLCRYDLLAKLIASARAGTLVPDRILVVDNGGQCPAMEGVEIYRPGRNLGVAASWNWLLQNAKDYLIISNDDVEVAPSALEKLVRAADSDQRGLLFASAEAGLFAWSLFLQRRQSLLSIGTYDEQFWPAYYEDNDYARRLFVAGNPGLAVPGVLFHHQQSATNGSLSDKDKAIHKHHWNYSLGYYSRKWGGPPRAEQYVTPFNWNKMSWEDVRGFMDYEALYEQMAKQVPQGGVVVEVGSYVGRSVCFLGQKIEALDKSVFVFAVEHGKGSADAAFLRDEAARQGGSYFHLLETNIKQCGLTGRVLPLAMTSAEAAAFFGVGSVDFVFLDGSHDFESVTADLKAWWPKVKQGGTLAGHDFSNPDYPGVAVAVKKFFGVDLGLQRVGSCFVMVKGSTAANGLGAGRVTLSEASKS